MVEGETGFSVPLHQPEPLAQKLRMLLTHGELRQRMGTAGRARYEELFTFERMMEKTQKVYDEILAQKR
jgi:glycosyltransferase involved in cell wall biosynthesis